MNRSRTVAPWLLLSLLASFPSVTLGANQNETRLDVTLTPSLFAPSQAVGDATYEVRRYRSDFEIDVEDLDPGVYDVAVGGVDVGQMAVEMVGGGTEGVLAFSTHPTGDTLDLGFDPRGKSIEIHLGATVFLSGTLSTEKNPEAPSDNPKFNKVVETINAVAPGIGARPRGTLKLVSGGHHASLLFKLQRLEDVPQTITANGVEVAYFTPLAHGIARVRFSTNPGKNDLPLDFDPVNTTFRIMLGDEVVLEFKTDGRSVGGGASPIGEISASFNRTDAAPDAAGSATLGDRATRLDLEIEVEDLALGSYDVLVGGVKRGTIVVQTAPDGTKGTLLFSTENAPGRFPLTFDPRGQTIQIARGATIYLSMTFPS